MSETIVIANLTARPDTVEGILCIRGHLNDPRRRYCAGCGSALLTRGGHRGRGPRPVVGMLRRDDGLRHPVSTSFLVVLREAGSRPTCVPPDEGGRALLRVAVGFDGWAPHLLAEGVGARLRLPDGSEEPLIPGVPRPLPDGAALHLGTGFLRYAALIPNAAIRSAPTPTGRAVGPRHRARRRLLPDRSVFPT